MYVSTDKDECQNSPYDHICVNTLTGVNAVLDTMFTTLLSQYGGVFYTLFSLTQPTDESKRVQKGLRNFLETVHSNQSIKAPIYSYHV